MPYPTVFHHLKRCDVSAFPDLKSRRIWRHRRWLSAWSQRKSAISRMRRNGHVAVCARKGRLSFLRHSAKSPCGFNGGDWQSYTLQAIGATHFARTSHQRLRRPFDLLALRRAQPRKRAAVSRCIFRPSSRGLVISGGSNPTGAPRRRRRQNHGAR